MELVYSAISVPLNYALEQLGGVIKVIYSSRTSGKEMEEKFLLLKPVIDDSLKIISESEKDSSTHTYRHLKKIQDVLKDGLDLVEEEANKIRLFDVYKSYKYGKKIEEFEMNLKGLLDIQPVYQGNNLLQLMAEVRDLRVRFEHSTISNTVIDGMPQATSVMGLDKSINAVKQVLFRDDINIVGVTGMGGSGKTTFASALCQDPDVKASFQARRFSFTLKRSNLDVKAILESMWYNITGGKTDFQSIQDARNQLQNNLSLNAHRPTLVVLDNVWSRSDLENLLFEEKGYKTVVTTREDSTIPKGNKTFLHRMPVLEPDKALSLFCFWAFGVDSIPPKENENLVRQVAAECKGLPLSLKVIGSSLREMPRPVWENAKNKLSNAEFISDYHRDELIKCLETSIDVLDEGHKQCFLDLGGFPEGRTYSVDSLLDIWVYVRGMKWSDAFEVLLKLASRNLLNLIGYRGSWAINSNCASEISFSQNDVMRDLALHLAKSDHTRLFMPYKEAKVSAERLNTLRGNSSGLQFVSIHTGEMEEQDWRLRGFPKFVFSKVEVLALFFQANQFCLPTFLQTMPNLKVLIIYNYSSKRATLSGLSNFPPLGQIRSVLLNKLIVPSIFENRRSWERLEKFYVCLCESPENIPLLAPNFPNNVEINNDPFKWLEKLFRWVCGGLGDITPLANEPEALNFPNMMEINIDHCSDLSILPTQLCNLTSLQNLSVTNCHHIQNLPDSLERYSSLRVLRLSACITLSRLEASICNLRQLEYLDISKCIALRDLPSEFDKLSSLDTLDMTECSGLRRLPRFNLPSLRIVIVSTDSRVEREWQSIKKSTLPNLTIDCVPEGFSLDWLDETAI